MNFDSVFRELAGLDNLLQVAGRCNREGRKENCVTYSFSFSQKELQSKNKEFQLKQRWTKDVFQLQEKGEFSTVSSSEAISYYFNRYFTEKSLNITSHDFKKHMTDTTLNSHDMVGVSLRLMGKPFILSKKIPRLWW